MTTAQQLPDRQTDRETEILDKIKECYTLEYSYKNHFNSEVKWLRRSK